MDEAVRLVLAVGIASVILLAFLAARFYVRRAAARHQGESVRDLATQLQLPAGRSSIIYVWSERCPQCIHLQEPTLARLEQERGVFVRKLNALEASDVVRRFNILTVPSTIVVDPEWRVRAVNFGYADAEALATQLT